MMARYSPPATLNDMIRADLPRIKEQCNSLWSWQRTYCIDHFKAWLEYTLHRSAISSRLSNDYGGYYILFKVSEFLYDARSSWMPERTVEKTREMHGVFVRSPIQYKDPKQNKFIAFVASCYLRWVAPFCNSRQAMLFKVNEKLHASIAAGTADRFDHYQTLLSLRDEDHPDYIHYRNWLYQTLCKFGCISDSRFERDISPERIDLNPSAIDILALPTAMQHISNEYLVNAQVLANTYLTRAFKGGAVFRKETPFIPRTLLANCLHYITFNPLYELLNFTSPSLGYLNYSYEEERTFDPKLAIRRSWGDMGGKYNALHEWLDRWRKASIDTGKGAGVVDIDALPDDSENYPAQHNQMTILIHTIYLYFRLTEYMEMMALLPQYYPDLKLDAQNPFDQEIAKIHGKLKPIFQNNLDTYAQIIVSLFEPITLTYELMGIPGVEIPHELTSPHAATKSTKAKKSVKKKVAFAEVTTHEVDKLDYDSYEKHRQHLLRKYAARWKDKIKTDT